MKWDDKPYYSLSTYYKELFNEKVYKISLDGSFTCPNRDGTLDNRGCIFCSKGGSGEFTPSTLLSITKQIEEGKALLSKKNTGHKYVAYFQAFTNTYGPLEKLRSIYYEAIMHPDIVGISIATRPDCLNEDILNLLSELNQIKKVWIELGLQTTNEQTAQWIRRGYTLNCFDNAVHQLNTRGIPIVVHLILGLPYEDTNDFFRSIEHISHLPISGVKLQLLHILEHTDLAKLYLDDHIKVLSQEAYIDLVIDCIERLPQNIVIHRITGDGPKDILIAPKWSGYKRNVLNNMMKRFKERNAFQGRLV
ncbi:hypothetical protein EDC19_2376 [Natranaerovirga hydrolytica]|uniref:Elp3/MiaA/NifB-like radical SAM core domain-containing protein n=1 Tax=Natranaerovirga hydrolytica TaxID=680378 RepID=A0A4R1MEP0_9FIRM|nr:TIGR01212 family radical SAM protein [Natranaerovirga hydrolytica]TCK90607.1 hypothetical protein EDC19_2376 [Natranaerovirga hydrolytica]